MAGSLNHIINDDGTFTKELVECGTGDCTEALAECHQIIAELLVIAANSASAPFPSFSDVRRGILKIACNRLGYPVPGKGTAIDPEPDEINVPVIQPELHGPESFYKRPGVIGGWLIWSNEHGAWWRPNSAGYTSVIEEAGRYTKADADRIVTNANRYVKDGVRPHEIAVKAPEAL